MWQDPETCKRQASKHHQPTTPEGMPVKNYVNQVGVGRPTLKVGGTMFEIWILDCIKWLAGQQHAFITASQLWLWWDQWYLQVWARTSSFSLKVLLSEDFITQIRKENKLPGYLLAHLLESQSIEHNLAFITTWGLGSRRGGRSYFYCHINMCMKKTKILETVVLC